MRTWPYLLMLPCVAILLYLELYRSSPQVMVRYAGLLPTPTPAPEYREPKRGRCVQTVSVGVVDTGIDYNHNDIAPYVDSRVGFNFVDRKALPFDDHGHGTHVAGLIVSQWKASDDVCLRLYSLKYYEPLGRGYLNLPRSTEALRHASHLGLDLLNYSGGGLDPSPAEREAVKELTDGGTLFVSAAGNDGMKAPYYPAAYGLQGQVTVASAERVRRSLLPSSNYGQWFEFATIGLGLRSTLPNNQYGTMSGTSQATAIITGMLAVFIAQDTGPRTGRSQRILQKLRERCRPIDGVTCGYVEPFRAP